MIRIFAMIVCLLAVSTPVVADVTPFGRININYNKPDVSGTESDTATNRFNGWGSRLGIKGASYLNETVEGRYILEIEQPVFADEDDFEFNPEFSQAWFGLRGRWGEIRLGRHLGPSRVALAPVDLFSSQAADQNAVLEAEVMHDRSVAYINRFNDIGYALTLSSNDDNNRISTDILANYNTEYLYLAAAYLNGSDERNTLRLGAVYRFPEGHHLGAAVERLNDTVGNTGHNAYLVNAGYKLGKVLLKAQAGTNKADAGGHTEKLWGVGIDYEAWRATTLKAQYSVNTHRDHTADDEERLFSLGLSYQF